MAQQGSLYLENGSWFVRYWEIVRQPDGSLKRKHPAHRLASVKDYPRKSEVIPLKNSFMEKLRKIGFTPEAGVSIVDFVENTFFPACERRLSGGGTKCYRDSWKCHIRQHVIGLRLRDFRPVDVQNLLNKEEMTHDKKLSHGSYKLMKITLSAIFTEARNLGLYEGVNPTTGVRIPKGKKHGRKRLAYSLEEILKHLQLFTSDPIVIINEDGPYTPEVRASIVRAVIGVTAFAGLRIGEVRGLWWEDDGGDVLSICRSMWRSTLKNTKTEEPRKVELPPSMIACLDAHRLRQDEFRRQFGQDYRSDLDLIFANPDGSPLMPNSISSTVSRLCRRLGLPKGSSLHVLRHSHASLLLADGVDLATVSARLGHSSVRTTADIYSHAIRGKDRVAAQVWDHLMQQALGEKSGGVTLD